MSTPDGDHRASAWFVGARLDVRRLEKGNVLGRRPLVVRTGERGRAVLFRYGSVVFVDVDTVEQARFLDDLSPFVIDRAADPESEDTPIAVDPQDGDRIGPNGTLRLRALDTPRLQAIASVLSKSVVLTHYEERVASVFDRVEGLALSLGRGRPKKGGRTLEIELGEVLLTQTQMVGKVEVTEKPNIVWDDATLDRLYEGVAAEYELRDRDLALSRKLDLIARTAGTYLELLHNRHSLRLEWYIVALFLADIALVVYDMFFVH